MGDQLKFIKYEDAQANSWVKWLLDITGAKSSITYDVRNDTLELLFNHQNDMQVFLNNVKQSNYFQEHPEQYASFYSSISSNSFCAIRLSPQMVYNLFTFIMPVQGLNANNVIANLMGEFQAVSSRPAGSMQNATSDPITIVSANAAQPNSAISRVFQKTQANALGIYHRGRQSVIVLDFVNSQALAGFIRQYNLQSLFAIAQNQTSIILDGTTAAALFNTVGIGVHGKTRQRPMFDALIYELQEVEQARKNASIPPSPATFFTNMIHKCGALSAIAVEADSQKPNSKVIKLYFANDQEAKDFSLRTKAFASRNVVVLGQEKANYLFGSLLPQNLQDKSEVLMSLVEQELTTLPPMNRPRNRP